MAWDIILSLIDSIVIVFVSVVLALEFYDSKDGILRKLMIALFSALALIYSAGAVVIVMQAEGFWGNVTLAKVRWITATPFAVIMVRLLYYRLWEMNKRK